MFVNANTDCFAPTPLVIAVNLRQCPKVPHAAKGEESDRAAKDRGARHVEGER